MVSHTFPFASRLNPRTQEDVVTKRSRSLMTRDYETPESKREGLLKKSLTALSVVC